MNETYKKLLKEINKISAIDIHTHLNASQLNARGLHDIMLYHMLISELYSSGCPDARRLNEQPNENEKIMRIETAIPYLEHIKNTLCYWLFKTILKDLYNWTEPVTLKNWQKLDEIIIAKSNDLQWTREILNRAKIEKASTELALQGNGSRDDLLFYALEWAFFARNQWGVHDAPLYELEYAWQFDKPVRPLGILSEERERVARTVKDVSDVREAMAHYCSAIPFDKVWATAQHISTDIDYTLVDDQKMQAALERRENAGQEDLNIYASYLLEAFLRQLEQTKPGFVFQFSFGAEPLPFETDSRLRQNSVKQIAEIISRHPEIHFQCFLSVKHANQSMCTLCRELPNLSLAGYWWHNLFPCYMSELIDERLDMLPTNKQIGFFSDAYCVEWIYAKSKLVRSELAKVLDKRINRGQYTFDEAIEVARKLLINTPALYCESM